MLMKYSQLTAMLAITKASLRSLLRSPSSIIFSFVFPFVFIIVFGFIGNSAGKQTFKIAMAANADTLNEFYKELKNTEGISIYNYNSVALHLKDAQIRGAISGIINITKNLNSTIPYSIELKSTTSSNDKWPQLKTLIESKINQISNHIYKERAVYATFNFDYKRDIAEVRQYKTIDFILPGQLGFSLLSVGVFGVAFTFFNLRSNLVLKRFFATPISRSYIILGEAISRIIFQMMTAIVIIGVGYFFFQFTLINGWRTFFEMLFLSFLGLVVFMGFGFIISGLAKNDSTIPPLANLITLPQFLLAGTFFSVDNFPKWLQPISKVLPLTHLNTAMRGVAFEGLNLWQVKSEIAILLLWGLVVYAVATKAFKWE
jgi:ABC-2 type transport system permease protein